MSLTTPVWSDDSEAPAAPIGAWADPHGTILGVSDGWEALTGKPPDEVVGAPAHEVSARSTPITDARGAPIGRWVEVSTPAEESLRRELAAANLARAEAEERLARLPRVAHDLNNVLAALMALSDNTSSGRMLTAGITHAAELVSQLTDTPSSARWVRVDGLVRSLVPVLHALVGPQVRLGLDLGAPSARLYLIPADFVQLVQNLVTNAGAAIRDGGRVTVETRSYTDGHGKRWLVLAVADTGVGIPPGVRESMFRAPVSTKRGGGMGLSIVASTVARFGGRLEVTSEPGQGTRVEAWLEESDEEPPNARS